MTIRNPFKKKPQKKADSTPAPARTTSYRAPQASRPDPAQQAASDSLLYPHVTPSPGRSDDCAPSTSHHTPSHTSHDSGSSYGGHSGSYDSGSSHSSSSYDGGSSSSSCDSGGGF